MDLENEAIIVGARIMQDNIDEVSLLCSENNNKDDQLAELAAALDNDGELDYNSEEEDEEQQEEMDMRMGLTPAEQELALEIKAMIASTPELRRFSDMMIAQIAVMSVYRGEGIAKVRDRLEDLQVGALDRFDIHDTLEQGKDILKRFVEDVHPAFVLHFYYDKDREAYVLVLDLAKFHMDIVTDDEKALIWLQGCYYLNHCQNPDLQSVRNGVVYIAECQGQNWKSKYRLQVKAYKEWSYILEAYPMHFQSVLHFHTNLFVNLMVSLGKNLIPAETAKRFQFGYVSEAGRLDTLYLQPSLELATKRVLDKLYDALELRYTNDEKYTLG